MLYKGSIYRKFAIDRLALGYSDQAICEMFETTYGEKVTIESLQLIAKNSEEEIKIREKELLEELEDNSMSIEGRLETLYSEVRDVLDELKKEKQWKQYASVLNGLLKNIELLAKSLGKLRSQTSPESRVMVQKNNYNAIVLLAEDKVISIADKKRLRKLLGIEEEDENVEEIATYA